MADIRTISLEALNELRKSSESLTVLDVRTPAEFQEKHLEFARSVPLHSLDPVREALDAQKRGSERIYLICHSAQRSKNAAERFLKAGIENVTVVEGGVQAWESANLPLVRGRKVISLERQVRIAAGSLVLTGVILGLTLSPGFFGISAFVGAGLVFAGVTDTCAMGLLLARMPWNQNAGGEPARCSS